MAGATTTELTTEERIRAATLVCIGRWGLAKTTLDDIVRESGVSRATIYRAFPGGREILIGAVLDDEATRFFAELAAEIAGIDDLSEKLVVGITKAFDLRTDHDALRAVLRHEPELVLPELAAHHFDEVLRRSTAFVAEYLRRHLPADEVEPAAEFVVRIVLSYALTPSPVLDAGDHDAVERFVRRFVVPALTAAT